VTRMKRARIIWLLCSSSFAYSFGLMSRRKLYERLDRAAELYGRGPAFFSGWPRKLDGGDPDTPG
jgi:hypothetical protein